MQKNYNITLFIILLWIAGNLFAQTDSVKHNQYFPFNEKTIVVYCSNIGEAVKSIEKKDSLFLVTNTTSKFIYTQSLIEKNDGIYLVKTEQQIDILFFSKDISITYSEPVLQLPYPTNIGDKWNWSGFQVKNGDTTLISIKGEVLKEEIVEVPAGKYKALKTKIDFREVDGEHTTIYKWLAPNIGNVKSKIIIEGNGVLQVAMSLLGYDEIDSELKEIRYKNKVSEKR